jgi:hypothetical protein
MKPFCHGVRTIFKEAGFENAPPHIRHRPKPNAFGRQSRQNFLSKYSCALSAGKPAITGLTTADTSTRRQHVNLQRFSQFIRWRIVLVNFAGW